MKLVILITVIESSAVMLAILYFYYRRNQSGNRALVLRHRDVTNGNNKRGKIGGSIHSR